MTEGRRGLPRTKDVLDVRQAEPAVVIPASVAAIAASVRGKAEQRQAKPSPRREAMGPTPEQMMRNAYVLNDVVNNAGPSPIKIGKAYQRQPKFERITGLDDEQLRALRYYRATFDVTEVSEVKSGLDIRPRGAAGSDGAIARMEALAFSKMTLSNLESSIGMVLHTLREVALHDVSFTDLAMKRYGSRDVEIIITGKGRQKPRIENKLAPKSGKHRDIIRDEFMLAVARLLPNARPYLRTGE